MRAYTELDGEAAGRGTNQNRARPAQASGLRRRRVHLGDHMKDLLLRGSADIELGQSYNDLYSTTPRRHPLPNL
jgi:hypothetical protein